MKIVLPVGGKELTLTEQEARELHAALDRMFGATRPTYAPNQAPNIIGPYYCPSPPPVSPVAPPWTVTC